MRNTPRKLAYSSSLRRSNGAIRCVVFLPIPPVATRFVDERSKYPANVKRSRAQRLESLAALTALRGNGE